MALLQGNDCEGIAPQGAQSQRARQTPTSQETENEEEEEDGGGEEEEEEE